MRRSQKIYRYQAINCSGCHLRTLCHKSKEDRIVERNDNLIRLKKRAKEKLSSRDWEKTLKTNVISHFYFIKLAIPLIKKNKGGSIINFSSGAGIMGFPLRSPYAASKWAVVGVSKTLAMELGKFKIRVNVICPGTIKGDRMVRVISDKSKFLKVSKKKIEKDFISMASMNCWIFEDDIGKMCSFLISDDASRISGQVIGVDGNAIRLD